MSYTDAQLVSQAITPKFSAFLSILGSSAILSELWVAACRRRKNDTNNSNNNNINSHRSNNKERRNNHRNNNTNRAINNILIGMSITDLSFSIGWFLTTWPSPKETTDYVWGASGNTQTCSTQAFFIGLGFWGTPVYNTILSLYYLLVIKHSWTQEQLLQRLDRFVHPIIWTIILLYNIVLVAFQLYNNYGVICWVQSLPIGCEGDDCIRGMENEWKLALFVQIFPIWPCIILNIIFMTRIYCSVRKVERRSGRYAAGGSSTIRKREVNVRNQALCYVGAMLFCLMPDAIYATFYYTSDDRSYFNFWFETIAYICLPLQGFLNFLIFMRQRKQAQSYLGRILMFCFCWQGCSSLWCCKWNKKTTTTKEEKVSNNTDDNNDDKYDDNDNNLPSTSPAPPDPMISIPISQQGSSSSSCSSSNKYSESLNCANNNTTTDLSF